MSSARPSSRGSRSSGGARKSKKSSTAPSAKASKKGSQEVAGLRTLVQQRLLKNVFSYCADNFDGWMVLIVDKKSMRAISSAVGMYDIMERNVTIVEDIEKVRAPFRDMGAIYVLAPTEESVNRLIADFEKPLYGNSVFLFFLGRIPEKQLEKIKACRPLLKRLKALNEANVDFLAKELRAYHFDMRRAFKDVYVRSGRSKIEYRMAEKLISICSTLNEYPHIRYAKDSPTAQALAKTLDVKLNQFLNNPDFWFHGDAGHTDRERATLLILDRKDDCLTPLMHDFTYQSMVNDLLPIKDDKITLTQESVEMDDDYDEDYDSDEDDSERKEPDKPAVVDKNAKDILLNENDNVWVELRGKHIAEVISTLSDRCREMVNSDTSGFSNKDKGKTMSLSQVASALKALPEYREVMDKLSQHMQLAHECMGEFNKRGLIELSELEQTLATGQTEDGAKPKLEDMMEQVKVQLKSMKDPKARFRLLLITIISQGGIKEEYKTSLWSAAQVNRDQEKLFNVLSETMDIPIINTGSGGSRFSNIMGSRVKSGANIDTESEFANSRYVPPLKPILEAVAANNLDVEEYPPVRDLPQGHGSGAGTVTSARKRTEGSARKGGATKRWQRSNQTEGNKDESYQGGRVIVFMIGGISYAELRVAREVMAKASREVVAGSTIFSNPNDFLDDLRRLVKSSSSRDSTRESTKERE
eukprot:CAMPEP_0119013322 /NCGR_PEP_ID=MMETSP1176-20130426/8390_1 /TAXON_ID=265551 /ORGANISM="Synedropsis recta cf, Strain CCMP1620" /LENGTH=699 /DNA_ID=CAMNT_0006966409 /DNA_START=51 /DNA_END=2150 /DNA_ORIENTATION=+